jgi:hypothetical protein
MPTKLVNLKIKHVAGVDRPANKRRFLIVKQEKEIEPKGATMLTSEQIAKMKDKDLQEAVVAQQEEMLGLEKKIKSLEDQIATGTVTKDDEAEIWKGVPPVIRNRFEAMKNEREQMEAKTKREKDEWETSAWVQKSAKFKYLQITPEHFGKVMKRIADHATAEADEIMRILSAADGLIEKGTVFMEYGRTRNDAGTGGADATNIVARVQSLAQDYRHLDNKLTDSAAIEKVFKDHPEWYPVYKKHSQIVTSGE